MDFKEIAKALNDKETTLKMAHSIIETRTAEMQEEELIKQMFLIWGKQIVNKNVNEIYTNSHSPIEKIFLNSVHFFGLIHDSRAFVFTPRNISIQYQLDRYKLMKKGMAKMKKAVKENNPQIDLDDVDVEILQNVENNGDEDFYKLVQGHHIMYEMFDLKNSFHFTLQTFVEDLKVDNKRVKPDITIWIPENNKFKLVVECDGFQFHSDKETFTKDRRKDRELQRNGYKVYRYSGTEIYNKPLETAFDLCNYLFAERQKMTEAKKKR